MLVELFLLTLFANDLTTVQSVEYSAPLQLTEEPSDIIFSSKTSAYLNCVAKATSNYASDEQIVITWRFGNGSTVPDIPNLTQILSNGSLWFKPFERLIPAIHRNTYQCVANLTNHYDAILSRQAVVRGVIVKPFEVTVEDQYVTIGSTAKFSCIFPHELSLYVEIRTWFADKEEREAEPSGNLVIRDIQNEDAHKLYYCIVVNTLSQENIASNVAKLFILNPDAPDLPLKFSIVPENKRVLRGETVLLECLATRTRNIEYIWKHNDKLLSSHLVYGRSLRIIDTTLDNEGKYTCIARDKITDEKIVASSNLLVQVPLAFQERPSKICTPVLLNVTFPCEVSGYPRPNITWYKNARKIRSNIKRRKRIGSSLVFQPAYGGDEGIYQCVASNGFETIHQAASLIVGAQAPRITKSFSSKNLSLYDKLDISCTASSATEKPELFWYRDNFLIEETSDGRIVKKSHMNLWTLQISNVTAADSGVYKCEATNRAGSNFSAAKVLVKGPAKVTYLPRNVRGLLGKDVSITCKAHGFPPVEITWLDKNGYSAPRGYRQKVPPTKDGLSTLTITGLVASDEGYYTCKGSNEFGPPDFAKVYLTVYGASEETNKPLEIVDEGSTKTLVCHGCIKWTKAGKVVQSSTRTHVLNSAGICILTIKSVLGSDAGKYTCHKQTKSTAVHTETTEIIVITKPRFIQTPNITDVLEHNDITMICHGGGFPTPRTIWRHKVGGSFVKIQDSSRFQIRTNGSLTIRNATVDVETDYSCEIKNSHLPGTDLTITLNVNVPARIENWLTSAFGDARSATTIECKASGDELLNFTWFKNGKKVTGDKNTKIQQFPKLKKSTLTFLSTTRQDDGDYICRVFNSFGNDEKLMKLKIRDKPDPPILTDKNETTKTSITIFWKVAFDGNMPITSYRIDYRATAHSSESGSVLIDGQETSCKITKLEPYTRYEIRVRAQNALGTSDFSNVIYVDTAEDVPSAAPTFTKVIPIDLSPSFPNKQALSLKWERLSVKNSNGIIRGHIIWYKKNSSKSTFTKYIVKRIVGNQANINNLQPYTHYKIKIQAFTNAGLGPNSSSIVRRTLEGVPIQAPMNVKINAKTSTSINLSWRAPSHSSLNGELTGYRVYYDENSKPIKYQYSDTSVNETSVDLKYLGKYTKYTIRVAARTVQGPGLRSLPINVVTNEDIPGPPKDLKATTTSVHSVKLEWEKPDEPNGKITYYKIYFIEDISKPDIYNTKHIEGTHTSYEVPKLQENRTYYFWVCAKTSVGEGNCTRKEVASTSKGPPSFVDNHSGDVTARWKTTVSLICRFSGFPIPNITWLDSNGKPLNLANTDKYHVTSQNHLVIHDLGRDDSKRYMCKVTNKWGTIKKRITLKVQTPPDPPKSLMFQGVNSTAVKISWTFNFHNGHSIITAFLLKYKERSYDTKWTEVHLLGHSTWYILNNVKFGRQYSFKMAASNEIGNGNFSETRLMRFHLEDMMLKPIEEQEIEDEIETRSSHKTILKDSAVLGTLIGVCLFIIIVIVVLTLLTKLGYNPGSKLVQRSIDAWRWFVTKSSKDNRRNMNRRSGGSSTDGHLGGSSSSLSQPASNNGSTFSLPRSSSRVTESGYAGSVFPIPLPFGNHTPGPNGGNRASGSSDEGIGPETRSEVHTRPGTSDNEYQPPPRSSNGTPAPRTLMMTSREYIDPEEVESPEQNKEIDEKIEIANESESSDAARGKDRIYIQSLGNYGEFFPLPVNVSPGRPKYDDAHFIIGPDVDRILAYRPPRCYDSTSSEYSSSRDELAQAYEFGKLNHLDDYYGRPTLESASSSGETASSEKDGICRFSSELSAGRPFLIPVAILPPPPNQRVRTNRKRNPQGSLNTYYEKDETLV